MIEIFINGIIPFSTLEYVLYLCCHITIVAITLYLHRGVCTSDNHSSNFIIFLDFSWLTTSMRTADWVAIHRKHHAKVETEMTHSPTHLWNKYSFVPRCRSIP